MPAIFFSSQLFNGSIPVIPRLFTALTEWAAVVALLFLTRRRFPWQKTVPLLLAGLVIQLMLRCIEANYARHGLFVLLMLLNVGFMLVCLKVLTLERGRNLIFVWLLAFLLAEFSASLVWQLCGSFAGKPSLLDIKVLAFTLTALFLLDFGFVRFIRRDGGWGGFRDSGYVWLSFGITVLVFIAGNIYVVLREDLWINSEFQDMRHMIGWVRTLSDLCGLILLWLLLRISREQQLQQDMQNMNQLIDLQYQQYLSFRNSNEYIRRQCYDLKHQVAVLRSSCSKEVQESHLSEMEQMIRQYQVQTDTGNKVLDIILTQKLQYCGQHGIALQYTANAAALSRLEVRDICTLFGNLLDNAVEAAEALDGDDRIIQMNVVQRNQFLSIQVENRCQKTPVFQEGLPVTSKRDGAVHGIGSQSIRYTAEKYDGTVHFEAKDGWFTAAVLLPVP